MFCERCGFVYLAQMRMVFSRGSGDAEPRMMRRRRGDAVYYVCETDTVFQMIEATRARFTQRCVSPSLPPLLDVLPSRRLLCAVKCWANRIQGRASLSLPPSLTHPLSNFFLSSVRIPAFFHFLLSLQARENTAGVLPVCILQK